VNGNISTNDTLFNAIAVPQPHILPQKTIKHILLLGFYAIFLLSTEQRPKEYFLQ
jgi:hypothetical protein